ncbi:uncharacterized protein RCC_01892 [Ramularia collo-cygni]|uniref:Mediator of RNA polymerase II transcription subunit 17 n=1 Tax=Ramularia collo-cygni TaxID=112498 RepID=A0A2D3UM50_9PEZI|nr:uncharacterized protein RCC_01892 [Ramularia collo-cygni]CZT16052.1 uncharacterized protein RCC_01892 [Ramularia collo-cygni]
MTSSLAFRPWDVAASTDPPPLKDTLARVAAERGHFRDITEAALLAEIEANSSSSEKDDDEDDNDDTSDTSADNEAGGQAKTVGELYTSRNEMLTYINAAQQEIAMALDFVSLLSTVQFPAAATTISPMLKNQGIPMASLGMDFWHKMPADPVREEEEAKLARAVRFSQLRESADDLLAAAERLEGNVRRERVFWEQILGVEERGWRVSRIPRAHGLLGVHFGFNGAAREFAERDLAALVAGEEDGGIVLERGVGTKPKAMRVLIKKDGRVVGSSNLPNEKFDGEEAGLEARIRAARDSLFDEELQHEMVREARGLLSLGVNMQGNTLSFPADDNHTKTIDLQLISLDEDNSLPPDSLHGSDDMAQALLLSARLLLSHSHRETLARRSQPPPPMSEKKDTETPVLALLRPLLRILKHVNDIFVLNTYLTNLQTVLGHADIDIRSTPAKFTLPLPSTPDSATLITTLLQPLRTTANLTLPGIETSPMTLDFRIETSPTTHSYTLILSTENQTYNLLTLEDLFEAADDFLAAELIARLHSASPIQGAVWELDKREGIMMRLGPNGEDDREIFSCRIWGQQGKMELHREGADGMHVVWGGEREELMSLWQAWREVVPAVDLDSHAAEEER